jgi:polar amino acid transport system substrate-binding protein
MDGCRKANRRQQPEIRTGEYQRGAAPLGASQGGKVGELTSTLERILLISALGAIAAQCPAQELTLVTEDYPPFNVVDPVSHAISGLSVDKVEELMRRAGQRYTLQAFPWSRAYDMAYRKPDTCAFSTMRLPQREAKFHWVGPLVYRYSWAIFARADDARRPHSLDDLRPFVMGSYIKGAAGEYLTEKGFKVDLADYDSDNPSKLLHYRFDFWAAGQSHGMAILRKQHLEDKIVPIFRFQRGEMYLACNLGISRERIDRFNQILSEMARDGTIAKLESKYPQGELDARDIRKTHN